jgi:hypothetical protein
MEDLAWIIQGEGNLTRPTDGSTTGAERRALEDTPASRWLFFFFFVTVTYLGYFYLCKRTNSYISSCGLCGACGPREMATCGTADNSDAVTLVGEQLSLPLMPESCL